MRTNSCIKLAGIALLASMMHLMFGQQPSQAQNVPSKSKSAAVKTGTRANSSEKNKPINLPAGTSLVVVHRVSESPRVLEYEGLPGCERSSIPFNFNQKDIPNNPQFLPMFLVDDSSAGDRGRRFVLLDYKNDPGGDFREIGFKMHLACPEIWEDSQEIKAEKNGPIGFSTLKFTPPPSQGKGGEFLADLKSLGTEFSDYVLFAEPPSAIDVSELSILLQNDLKGFASRRTLGAFLQVGSLPVDNEKKEEVSAIVLKGLKRYIASKCPIREKTAFRVVVILSGSGNETHFDNNQNPNGVINIKLFLIDSSRKTIVWYSDKAWGVGQEVEKAAEFAVESISTQLDNLFGQ